MNILVIQNHPTDPAGVLGDCVLERNGKLDVRLPLEGDRLPLDHRDHDGLIVMGGAMHAEDDDRFPHLLDAVALIQSFHAAAKPIMGVCLGAQLVARSFGQRVYRHDVLELGFTAVFAEAAIATDPVLAHAPEKIHLMQWHFDTFDLPKEATLLMSNPTCERQAYRIGTTTYGFQFHLEVTAEILQHWLREESTFLENHYPHFPAQLAQQSEQFLAASQTFCRQVGHAWLNLVQARASCER